MATVKLVLDQRKMKQNGTFPLLLRVTHLKKSFPIPLGVSIEVKYWNATSNRVKQNCPIYNELDELIRVKEAEIRKATLKLEQKGLPYKIIDIQQQLGLKSLEGISFNKYAERCVEQMKLSGRAGNAISYKQSVDSLIKFSKKELQFHDINYRFLSDYETYMKSNGIKTNTIASYLRGIRAIFNRAINEEVTSYEYYPFRKFRLKTEATPSRAISLDKLKALMRLNLEPNTRLWNYLNYFKLMFCLIGINFSDLCTLTKENIVGGRLNYRRKKTKRLYSILLHPIALDVIKQYEGVSGKYLLPILPDLELDSYELKLTVTEKLKMMNKALNRLSKQAKTGEHISTYTSRYSWANIAKELGISKEVIAEALGHSYGNAVTGIYLDSFDKKVMDKANFDVIQAVLGDKVAKMKVN